MTQTTRTPTYLSLGLYLVLMVLEGTVFLLQFDQPRAAVLVVWAAVTVVAIGGRFRRGPWLVALASMVALTASQWPAPEIWFLNLAVCLHLPALWSSRNRKLTLWYSHGFIVSSAIIFVYCLGGRHTGLPAPPQTVLGIGIMVCCWLLIQAKEVRVSSGVLYANLAVAVMSALLLGLGSSQPVLLATQRVLRPVEEVETKEPGDDKGQPGQSDDRGLNLSFSPGKGESTIRAYLAVKNPPSRPRQYQPPFYLREEGYSTFTGRGWIHATREKRTRYDSEDGTEDGWTQTSPPLHDDRTRYRVFLPEVRSSWLLALPGTNAFDLSSVDVAEDDGYQVKSRRGGYITYSGQATAYRHLDLPNSAVIPTDAEPRFYRLPDLPIIERLRRTTATVVGKAATPSEKIRRIVDFLETYHGYLLQTDPNRATLSNFLYGERKGHCTLFATSCTLMLRIAGIPSRVAVGYAGGAFDRENSVFVFKNQNAHAWTEYKTKDHGWVILDATPVAGQVLGIAQNSDFARNADLYSPLEKERAKKPQFKELKKNPTSEPEPEAVAATADSPNFSLLTVFAAVAVAYLFLNFLGANARKRKRATATYQPPHQPATDFFSRFCAVFTAKGAPRMRSQTALEYLHLLKARGHVADEWDDMIAYYYAVCYEGVPPSREREDEFIQRMEPLTG